ncbi:MAG TPA: SDR family oxidoreductase [Chitinophagaceae bacterium]|nr:SDR family oxidoreductase [Chitinophagaceae bacterium]
MNLSLEGKNAVICGSTQGIGLAIAEELALMGANCVLMARNEESLQAALIHLDTTLRQEHYYEVADFSDTEDVRKKITLITATQNVHILINNTGGPAAGPIINAEEEAFLAAFNQHVICNHILTKAVVPGMKEDDYGRIINVVSTSVKIPLPNLGVSNTIRGAVASWAKTMANELGQFNITVNNVLPGLTSTGRLDSLINTTAKMRGLIEKDIVNEMAGSIPAKRFGTAAEIAAVAAFLASPAASYVNGVSIQVDGGRTGSI